MEVEAICEEPDLRKLLVDVSLYERMVNGIFEASSSRSQIKQHFAINDETASTQINGDLSSFNLSSTGTRLVVVSTSETSPNEDEDYLQKDNSELVLHRAGSSQSHNGGQAMANVEEAAGVG